MQKLKTLKKGFTLIELMIVVAIIGILSAIAIPNFIKFQARSKQSEAKANLKSIFTAQRSYFQEKDTYGDTLSGVGFAPERGNRYYYELNAGSGAQTRADATVSSGSYGAIEADTFKYGTTNFAASYAAGGAAPTWVARVGRDRADRHGRGHHRQRWSVCRVCRRFGGQRDERRGYLAHRQPERHCCHGAVCGVESRVRGGRSGGPA